MPEHIFGKVIEAPRNMKVGFATGKQRTFSFGGAEAQWRAHWLFALRTDALRGDVRACRQALRRVSEASWLADSELGCESRGDSADAFSELLRAAVHEGHTLDRKEALWLARDDLEASRSCSARARVRSRRFVGSQPHGTTCGRVGSADFVASGERRGSAGVAPLVAAAVFSDSLEPTSCLVTF